MGQSEKNTKSESGSAKKKRWIHKRTIAVVLCVVILPWVLIGIPGTLDTGDQVAGWNIYHLAHGWPFVHLETTHYQKVGNSAKGRYQLGHLPAGAEVATSAKEVATIFAKHRPQIKLNLRLEKDRHRAQWLGKISYWSDGSNWPILKTGVHLTPRYVGMLLNLFCIVLLALIVAALSEYRIRRYGGLLKYTLANLLLGIAVISIACAWIARMHLDHEAQARLDEPLQALSDKGYRDNNGLQYFRKHHEARFPLIVSQLLNHGRHPWGSVPFFRQVKSGTIGIVIHGESDIDRLRRIKNLATSTKYSIALRLTSFTPETQKMFNALNGVKPARLNFSFNTTSWWFEETKKRQVKLVDKWHKELQLRKDIKRAEFQQLLKKRKNADRKNFDWAQAIEQSGFKVDIDIDMSKLESLCLRLDGTISQEEQLQPFVGLPSLKKAQFLDLSTEGAEFIMETKGQWSKNVEFDFTSDVSQELQTKLKSEFAD